MSRVNGTAGGIAQRALSSGRRWRVEKRSCEGWVRRGRAKSSTSFRGRRGDGLPRGKKGLRATGTWPGARAGGWRAVPGQCCGSDRAARTRFYSSRSSGQRDLGSHLERNASRNPRHVTPLHRRRPALPESPAPPAAPAAAREKRQVHGRRRLCALRAPVGETVRGNGERD